MRRSVVVVVAVAVVAAGAAVAIVAMRSGNDEEQRRIEVFRTDYSAAVARQAARNIERYCKKVDCTATIILTDSDRQTLRLVELPEKQEQPPDSWGTQLREWCVELALCERRRIELGR